MNLNTIIPERELTPDRAAAGGPGGRPGPAGLLRARSGRLIRQ